MLTYLLLMKYALMGHSKIFEDEVVICAVELFTLFEMGAVVSLCC